MKVVKVGKVAKLFGRLRLKVVKVVKVAMSLSM